jgi:hypothetical protein
MEPVTLIVTALAAGAASALQDDAEDAVKAALGRLRAQAGRRLSGRPAGELVLAQHEQAPDVPRPPAPAPGRPAPGSPPGGSSSRR